MSYIAKQFQAHPGAEIIGYAISTVNYNLREEVTKPIFTKYNLDPDKLQPDEWYPLTSLAQSIEKSTQKDAVHLH